MYFENISLVQYKTKQFKIRILFQIVEADYAPLPEGEYSEKMKSTIALCVTAEAEKRPDIIGVAAHIAVIMLTHMDGLRKEQITLEKRLEREKRKTHK